LALASAWANRFYAFMRGLPPMREKPAYCEEGEKAPPKGTF
jgi:hypothetical protein